MYSQQKAGAAETRSLIFGLADLHSLTVRTSHQQRSANIRGTFAAILALGIDNAPSTRTSVFVQSQISAHAEMMWILSNYASMGHLSRMTQWKDKLAGSTDTSGVGIIDKLEDLPESLREQLKLGLFSYPVLQAADILLYDSNLVPVGEDQVQHVEFARNLARSFNSATGHDILQVPSVMLSPAKRIMSLQDPLKKMSKSQGNEASRILITDEADVIRQKIKSAKTDSEPGPITYTPDTRPGVSNLIDIYRYTSQSELTSGPSAQGPPSRIILNRAPSSQRPIRVGRGGAGNFVKTPETEQAMFQFDEEMHARRENQAPVYHIGRGGAANFVKEKPNAQRQVSSDASSVSSGSSAGSARRSIEGAIGKFTRKLSSRS